MKKTKTDKETSLIEGAKDIIEARICGVKVSDIRKAYFSKKIPQLLAEILAKGEADQSEIAALIDRLQGYRDEELEIAKALSEKIPSIQITDDPKPPTVKQLTAEMSQDQKAEFEQWQKEKDWAVGKTRQIMRDVAKALIQKINIPKQEFMNYAHELVGLMGYLNEDKVWKEQLYMKRLTDMIDSYGISRREAEDRSKVTQEYSEFKNANNILAQVDQFIMNCKKEYSGENI